MISPVGFITDPSLGKLCKWLRILGFNALREREAFNLKRCIPTAERHYLLTRVRALKDLPNNGRTIFIVSNDPMAQLRQVIQETGISKDDIHLLSRCIRCNQPIAAMDRASVFGRVPDYIWETAERIDQCPECGRFYWRGSHSRRIANRIRQLFGPPNGS